MAAGGLFSRALQASRLARLLSRLYHDRLTARGRYALWLALALGFVGLDTLQAHVYVLFALVAGPFLVALALAVRPRPRIALAVETPARLTAGRAALVRVRVACLEGRPTGPLVLGWRWGGSPELRRETSEVFVSPRPGQDAEGQLSIRPESRGRFTLPSLGAGRTDPLGLASTRRVVHPAEVVLAYPRFYGLQSLALPVGRRYQPGGIPLASSLGDSTEFVGTRDFREGDPLRRVHWRSWARRGRPVVKEYHDEYFSRVALVLDTCLPRRPRAADRQGFEAAISLLASIADRMSRSEEVVDVLAAGPDLYEVSAGRSLGYLGNVLDVLACLQPCAEPPFAVVAAPLAARLARLTAIVAVVLDWDEGREAFLRSVRRMGVAVVTFVVRAGATSRRYEPAAEELGPITLVTPGDIESRLRAAETEGKRSGPALAGATA
jgi:uncharacterized protein (DUF58 family)